MQRIYYEDDSDCVKGRANKMSKTRIIYLDKL